MGRSGSDQPTPSVHNCQGRADDDPPKRRLRDRHRPDALSHSLVVGLYAPGGSQVGLARAFTDRATFAWIADVFVLEPHRRNGLGRFLVQTLLEHPNLAGLRPLMLATADAHELYRSFGFESLEDPRALHGPSPLSHGPVPVVIGAVTSVSGRSRHTRSSRPAPCHGEIWGHISRHRSSGCAGQRGGQGGVSQRPITAGRPSRRGPLRSGRSGAQIWLNLCRGPCAMTFPMQTSLPQVPSGRRSASNAKEVANGASDTG